MNKTRIATYLPPWDGGKGIRVVGNDEDSVTLSVAAGLAAMGDNVPQKVIVVTREPALLEGGSSAVICAGLGLANDVEVIEQIGGAPVTLSAVATAAPGTLVIGADIDNGAGAGAVFIGDDSAVTLVTRIQRSLPLRTRHNDGSVYEDDDGRLMRERGVRASIQAANLDGKPLSLAGVAFKEAKAFQDAEAPQLPTLGASSPIFALAALAERDTTGPVAAMEQANLSVAKLNGAIEVLRDEKPAQPVPKTSIVPGDIKIAYTAYERAFDSKLRWEAGCCDECGTLAMPPRHRCFNCGAEGKSSLKPLPRTGSIYSQVTIRAAVPGVKTPYSLAIVQLDGVEVRTLVTITDVPPNSTAIEDRGSLVFRRVAMRTGVPDYGYALSPEVKS